MIMEKAIKILQDLKPYEKNYKAKVKLLADIIQDSIICYICPENLVDWCNVVGLKTELNCEDKTSWWTVSGK